MKALLYKNFVSNKTSYIITLIIVLMIIAYALYKGVVIIIPGVFLFLSVILSAMTMGTDVQSKVNKFTFTSPISRMDYVKSMYFMPLVFACLSFLVTGGYLLYLGHFDSTSVLLLSLLALAAPLILSSIYIPLLIKYGAEKGRLLMVVSYIVIFVGLNLLSERMDATGQFLKDLVNLNSTMQMLGIIGMTAIVCYLSIRWSRRIELKKEF